MDAKEGQSHAIKISYNASTTANQPTGQSSSYHLCGFECVSAPELKSESKDEPCCTWRECFGITLSLVIWIGVAAASIYWIVVTQRVLYECRVLSNFARHDCLNRHNGDVVGYSFAFCLLAFAIMKSVLLFLPRNEPRKCINGAPNNVACECISAWSLFLGTLIMLFIFIYCLQFMEDCRQRDDDDSPESKACRAYKENDLSDKVAGAVISGFLFCIMVLISPVAYFKEPNDCTGCAF